MLGGGGESLQQILKGNREHTLIDEGMFSVCGGEGRDEIGTMHLKRPDI